MKRAIQTNFNCLGVVSLSTLKETLMDLFIKCFVVSGQSCICNSEACFDKSSLEQMKSELPFDF